MKRKTKSKTRARKAKAQAGSHCFVKKTAKPGRPKADAKCKICGKTAASHSQQRKRIGQFLRLHLLDKVSPKEAALLAGITEQTGKSRLRLMKKRRSNPLVLDPGGISYTGPFGPMGYMDRLRYPNARRNPPKASMVGPVQLTHDDRFNSFRAMLNQYDRSPAWGPGLNNNPHHSTKRRKKAKRKAKRRIVRRRRK